MGHAFLAHVGCSACVPPGRPTVASAGGVWGGYHNDGRDAVHLSWQRFAGTALGAAAGPFLTTYFGSNALVFSAGVLALGLICAGLHLDKSGYRFSRITLAIVMLVAHTKAAWLAEVRLVAAQRFVEALGRNCCGAASDRGLARRRGRETRLKLTEDGGDFARGHGFIAEGKRAMLAHLARGAQEGSYGGSAEGAANADAFHSHR
jgi:hypothetical protein